MATPTDGRHRLARPRRSVAVGQSHLGRKPRWPTAGSFVATRRRWPGPMVAPAGRGGGRDRSRTGCSAVNPSGLGSCPAAGRHGNTAAFGWGWGSRHRIPDGRDERKSSISKARSANPPATARRGEAIAAPCVWRGAGPAAMWSAGNPGGSRIVADVWFLERALGRRPVCDDRPRDGGVSVATGRA